MEDAVLTTLGREMGAYAEGAHARIAWRIYKCEERLRVVNLGRHGHRHRAGRGRASTSSGSWTPLRDATGHRLRARREPLRGDAERRRLRRGVSGTQACAVSLLKICSTCGFLASGPEAGWARSASARQGGAVDHARQGEPGDPEAVSQAAMKVLG